MIYNGNLKTFNCSNWVKKALSLIKSIENLLNFGKNAVYAV